MAKRSSNARYSKRVDIVPDIPTVGLTIEEEPENFDVEDFVDETEAFEFEEEHVEFVRLQLNKELLLTAVGEVTGTVYKWNGAGSVINVDKRDADKIIENMRTVISCCGSFSTPKFSIV